VAWPGMGRWDIKTEIRKGEDRFSMEERVIVR
jgi:ABC-type antimicrobial peptide transport system permease subunit